MESRKKRWSIFGIVIANECFRQGFLLGHSIELPPIKSDRSGIPRDQGLPLA